MRKKIDVKFNWIDNEVAEIHCPYCNKYMKVSIYGDSCSCGKKFKLFQENWVEEDSFLQA